MADVQELEKESFIQKWVAWIVGGILIAALALYLYRFHGPLSHEQGRWGEFGDFLGGAVNPIVGFFTILLLSVSLRQNHKALSQANSALLQAKEELTLTRDAIEQATGIQKATEKALKEQIEIAAYARDMNNTVALFTNIVNANMVLRDEQAKNGGLPPDSVAAMLKNNQTIYRLSKILQAEEKRLVERYGPES